MGHDPANCLLRYVRMIDYVRDMPINAIQRKALPKYRKAWLFQVEGPPHRVDCVAITDLTWQTSTAA
jgi:hypothetical protein